MGHDGQVLDEDDAYERVAANDPGIIERWDEMERRFPGYDDLVAYHTIRQFFGIESFGIAAWTAPAGQCVVPPHSETAAGYHQEELYIVLAGSAKVVCDGEEMVLKLGQLLDVSPDVFREGRWRDAHHGDGRRRPPRPGVLAPVVRARRSRRRLSGVEVGPGCMVACGTRRHQAVVPAAIRRT